LRHEKHGGNLAQDTLVEAWKSCIDTTAVPVFHLALRDSAQPLPQYRPIKSPLLFSIYQSMHSKPRSTSTIAMSCRMQQPNFAMSTWFEPASIAFSKTSAVIYLRFYVDNSLEALPRFGLFGGTSSLAYSPWIGCGA